MGTWSISIWVWSEAVNEISDSREVSEQKDERGQGQKWAELTPRVDWEQSLPGKHREQFILWEMQSVPAWVRLSASQPRQDAILLMGI